MSYSPALSYFLERLSGVSTNVFKLEPQNQNDSSANKIVRFSLPSNALLNTRSFAVMFSASCGTNGGRLPAKIDTLIERVELSAGGVQVQQGVNHYNILRHAKDALTGDHCNKVLGHPEMVRNVSYVDGSTITNANGEIYGNGNGETQFCIDFFEGFLGTCEPKILDSSILPDLVVTIYLADNVVCSSVAGNNMCALTAAASATQQDNSFGKDGTVAPSYSLNNIYAQVEALGLADATYDNLVASMIAAKGYLEIPFKQYFSYQNTHTGSTRFTVATQSLDRIWTCFRDPNYSASPAAPVVVNGMKISSNSKTANASTAIETGVPQFDSGGVLEFNKEQYRGKYYNFVEPASGSMNKYQFQLNGAYFPQFPASAEAMYQISKNSTVGYFADEYSLDTYKNNFFVQCIRLNLPDSEYSRLISGLDTRAIAIQCLYNTTNLQTNTNPTLNIFCECTSTLRVGAGKMLEVIV